MGQIFQGSNLTVVVILFFFLRGFLVLERERERGEFHKKITVKVESHSNVEVVATLTSNDAMLDMGACSSINLPTCFVSADL